MPENKNAQSLLSPSAIAELEVAVPLPTPISKIVLGYALCELTVHSRGGATATLLNDGRLLMEGPSPSSGVAPTSNVQWLCANYGAFAAVLADGSVRAWGDPEYGGAMEGLKGVCDIEPFATGFSAAMCGGGVTLWGRHLPPEGVHFADCVQSHPASTYTALTFGGHLQRQLRLFSNGHCLQLDSLGAVCLDEDNIVYAAKDGTICERRFDGTLLRQWPNVGKVVSIWKNILHMEGGRVLLFSGEHVADGVREVCCFGKGFAFLFEDGSLRVVEGERSCSIPGVRRVQAFENSLLVLQSCGTLSSWGEHSHLPANLVNVSEFTILGGLCAAICGDAVPRDFHCWRLGDLESTCVPRVRGVDVNCTNFTVHLNDSGLRIGTSTISPTISTNRGVFATRVFHAGEIITEYDGEIGDWEENGRNDSHTIGLDFGSTVILGIGREGGEPVAGRGVGSFINDNRATPNAKYLRSQRLVFDPPDRRPGLKSLTRVWIQALRRIEPGEELFCSYGRAYWRKI